MTTTMTTREQMEKLAADMRVVADVADSKSGDAAAEDQARLVAMANDFKELRKRYEAEKASKSAMSDVTNYIGSLSDAPESAIKALGDVKPKDLTASGFDANPNGKTLGQLFVESDAYRHFVKKNANLEGIISAKNVTSSPFELKTLITGASSTSGGAAVRNDFYAPITDLAGERELTVRDLVTQGQTASDTVEYVRVTSTTNSAAPVAEATSSAVIDGTTVTNAMGGVKPESGMALEVVSTTVKTIAHWIPITKRAASDAGQVRTLVENFLLYGLNEELEDQMLTGAGTGENFTGILNTTGIQTTGSAGTDLDAIIDAIRLVRVTGRRRPTAVVFHPNDWYSTGFLLAKDSQGRYLIGDPARGVDQLDSLWGLRVVVSEGMTENTALVGDFRQAVLWDREQAAITMTDSHSDFFVRNLLVILAEMRAAFGVLDPQGFCSVTAV